MRKALYQSIVLATSALAAGAVLPAYAQDGGGVKLEEIVVTAQRRSELVQDVPIAVVALSSEILADRGVSTTVALPEVVPSVQFTSSGGSGIFFVRGVGNTNAGIGEEGSNAFYVDGVYMPDLLQSVLRFNNIERVEVLKGPQGTLFGRNSTGGLVHVITKEPGDEFTADVKVGAANYETFSTQAYVAGPLTETVSADLALAYSDQNEGWGKNLLTGEEVATSEYKGVRSKVVWEPTDTAKLTFSGEYGELDDTTATNWYIAPGSLSLSPQPGVVAPPASPGDEYDTTADGKQVTLFDVYGGSVTGEFDLDWATFTSITAYRKLESENNGVDVDAGPYSLLYILLESTVTEAFQQEFRLASNSDGPLSWQAGLFYLDGSAELSPQRTSGLLLLAAQPRGWTAGVTDNVEQTTESLATFGEITYSLTDSTQLIAGLRYTTDKRDFEGRSDIVAGPAALFPLPSRSMKDSTSDEEVTYRLALRHDLNDNINLYASYNRGFKSGLFSMNSYPWTSVEPQTIDAYEVGMKSELFDSRIRLNLSAFHYEIDDYQVRSTTSNSTQLLLNAAEVEVDGLEAEFEAAVTEALSLFGSATFLNSEFASFPNSPYLVPNPAFVGGNSYVVQDAAGNDTPLAPEFAANLGASYLVPVEAGDVRFTTSYSYNDGYFFDPGNSLKQSSFALLNASVAYNSAENWGVEFWARNLTDEEYLMQKAATPLSDVVVRAAPRTFGVNLSYRY